MSNEHYRKCEQGLNWSPSVQFSLCYPTQTNQYKCQFSKKGTSTCDNVGPFVDDEDIFLIRDNFHSVIYCLLCFCKLYAPTLDPYTASEEEIVQVVALANRISGQYKGLEQENPFTTLKNEDTMCTDLLEDFLELPADTFFFPVAAKHNCGWCLSQITGSKIVTRIEAKDCPIWNPSSCCNGDSSLCSTIFCSFACAYNHAECTHGIEVFRITGDMIFKL